MTKPRHPDAATPRWGVVSTCLEPTPLVVAFAAHYIGLGAHEVRLFLDAPQPDLEEILDQIPQVSYRVCDAAYWKAHSRGRRPKGVEFRQLVNAYDAYDTMDVDWMGHFDADEFAHADLPIGQVLGAIPDEIEFLLLRPRERAFLAGAGQAHLFEGIFRRPVPNDWPGAHTVFGRERRFMRSGVLSHPHGKSFVRTGGRLLPGIHTPRRHSKDHKIPLHGIEAPRMRLLHFDGLTALHWSGKLLRAVENGIHAHFDNPKTRDRHRARQLLKIRHRGANLQSAWDLHEMLKCVPDHQANRLRALGLIEDYVLRPEKDIARLNLKTRIDLSRAAFDRALEQQVPRVAEWLTEWEELMDRPALRRTGS